MEYVISQATVRAGGMAEYLAHHPSSYPFRDNADPLATIFLLVASPFSGDNDLRKLFLMAWRSLNMADLTRISISLETALLEAFDRQIIAAKGYPTRSEAVRDLIRDRLIRDEAVNAQGEQVAVVTLVYDHHARELAARLIDKQHHHHELVISSLHVHLGERHCLEVSILRGPAEQVRHLGDELLSTKGVLHGEIIFTTGEGAFNQWR